MRHAPACRNWNLSKLTVSILFLLSGSATAQISSGWWWNPAEGGRGFFIEQQGSTVFLVGYLYESSGRATWATAQLEGSSATDFSGDLLSFRNGQTLTGSWKPNEQVSPALGTIRLVLSDASHATLTWPGGTLPIERFALISGGLTAAVPNGTPETGWWWNPLEPGRGYAIEIQSGVIFVGGYMYDNNGDPIWYVSGQEPMNDPLNYGGNWVQYAGGQTLNGPYRPATRIDPAVGTLGLSFANSISASLRLPDGRNNPITRFVFSNAPTLDWTANLRVSSVASPAAALYPSSSKLRVDWAAPTSLQPTHYVLTATDSLASQPRTFTSTTPGLTLTELKAATEYRIELTACSAQRCFLTQKFSTAATTPTESWQLQGSGNNVAGLRKIVADGNVKIHAFRYGADAPANLAGHVQLYYGAQGNSVRGLAVATTAAAATAANPSSYLDFSSRAGSSGLISPTNPVGLVREVATGQAVPLNAANGDRVRLYFEANGSDNKTRILAIDAKDGQVGLDFNSGSSTVCSNSSDYSVGGGCAPSIVIGVEGDAIAGNNRIPNVRQFKIGYPTQDDWRWNGASGTYMIFTVDTIPGCSSANRNHGYAVFDGSEWRVQYLADGCPKLFKQVQAAHPLHIGGSRYKMYYGDTSDLTGALAGSNLPFLGRKRLIYADGERFAQPGNVDFEDWENVSAGRRLNFLWPDGSTLDTSAEGYIDDFSVLAPTGNLDLQVLYIAITDGRIAPLTAAAVLLNP